MLRKDNHSSGFTLIELLIVIAILGILAAVLFVLLDPGERQAQARDTGRISSISQIGRSLQAFYTSQDGTYPTTGNWAQDLIDVGELSTFPSGIDYTAYSVSECTTLPQPAADPTYCYDVDGTGVNGAIVFATAEANQHTTKCTSPESAYFVYSTADGRGGTICSEGDPAPWASGTQTYVN